MVVGIGLKELSSLGRGNPTTLAKPSHKMAAVAGSDLGGPLPEEGHGELTKHLVCGDIPGVSDEVCPCVRDDKYVPECIRNSSQ